MAFTSIVVSGGAMKLIAAIGCIQYLEELQMRQYIQNFVGTSAGAIICFFMVLGYTSHEIRDFILEISESPIITDILHMDDIIDNMCMLSSQMAISNGNNLTKLFQAILSKKTNKIDITFIDIAKMYGQNLVICASNITKEQHEFFCVDTTPEMSVIDALRMSCSIPLLFSPVTWNNAMYIDGGLYCNFPLTYFKNSTHNLQDILGINVRNKTTSPYKHTNIFQYAFFLINSLLGKFNDVQVDNITKITNKYNVITLEIEDTPLVTFDTMKLTFPTKETIDNIVIQGYMLLKDSLGRVCTDHS